MDKISATMIVKNEEENLPRALKSIKNFVDEIVIVDTGSTDKTIEIAKEFGAKVYLHPHPKEKLILGKFIDDFSYYRNLAIHYATGDWVLIIDADGELVQTRKTLKRIKRDISRFEKDIIAVAFPTVDIQRGQVAMQFNPVRLFRNGQVKYKRRVHNKPVYKGDNIFYPDLEFRHYGYDMTPEQKLEKQERIIALLNLSLKDDPSDYELYFYFNQVYALQRNSKVSVEWGEKYIEKNDEGKINRFNHTIFFTMFRSYQTLNDRVNATKIIRKGLETCPDDMDLNVALLELGIWTDNHVMVEKGAENYIKLYDKFNGNPEAIVQNKFLLSNNPKTYTFCKQNLASIRLQQAIVHLKDIRLILDALKEEDFKRLVNKNIFKLLDAIGCFELRTILQPAAIEIQDIH